MTDIQETVAPGAAIELQLVSLRRERGKLLQKLQHVLPAVVLLGAGVNGLRQGVRGFGLALAAAELVVSLLLLRMAMKEVAAARRPHSAHTEPHGADWFEIFAAGVLYVEALERWHVHHHLPRPMLLTATLTLALGLFHRRFSEVVGRGWVLRIDEAGIRVHRRFRRRFVALWPDIERIDLDEDRVRIVARGGMERRIDLRDLRNAAEVRQTLLAAQARLAPSLRETSAASSS